jgi:hypothetical protein
MFHLKPLSPDAIPAALEKAVRYRLLNEPAEAESICRDVLDIDPQNQQAIATLVLALTDLFRERLGGVFSESQALIARLSSDYEKAYYSGIVCERRAKAHLRERMPDSAAIACDWLRRAMQHFEQAETLRPAGNDESILRWNTCARILMKHPEHHEPVYSPSPMIELE